MENKLKLIHMDEVIAQEVDWLWYPYIPCGKITLLQGDPGEGKTMLALLSKGLPLPGQEEAREPIHTIFQTAEDSLADTIKPRLLQAGADCERISVIDESRSALTVLDNRLEQAIVSENAKLLILDPLQAFLGSEVDMHRANEVRPALHRLADTAERTGCAVVIVGHMNKMQGAKGIYRGLGSIDIPAIARSILLIGRETPNDTNRYMAQIKNSLTPIGKSLQFTIDNRVRFLGTSMVTAGSLLSEGKSEWKQTKAFRATELLRQRLLTGDAPASQLVAEFAKLDIGEKTLINAKRELGVHSYKQGKLWYWSLEKQEEASSSNEEKTSFGVSV